MQIVTSSGKQNGTIEGTSRHQCGHLFEATRGRKIGNQPTGPVAKADVLHLVAPSNLKFSLTTKGHQTKLACAT